MCIAAKMKPQFPEIDMDYNDDGIAFRLPELHTPPPIGVFLVQPQEALALVFAELPHTALFSTRFRGCAARSLLMTRSQPGKRMALWAQRRRALDLLAAVARYPDFPS